MSSTTHADSPAIYAKILGVLLVLTVVTVLAAGVNFGTGNVIIALAIASVKASLVALFFMHLRHDKATSSIILIVGMVMLTIFLVFCYVDSEARDQMRPVPTIHRPALPPGAAPAKPAA